MPEEIIAKTALHYHAKTFATNWDLNVYRGCGHLCKYCFAQYSHRYLASENFFGDIFVKTNIAEVLDKQLSKRSWKFQPITVSGVSDCYQPIEKKYQLMPDVLKVFIKHENPITITTKSTLILRDIELIQKLNEVAEVSIGTSISAINESVRKKVEPGAVPAIERLKMLQKFSEIGIRTTVLLMPIIPLLTDNRDELEEIFRTTKEFGIGNILSWPLHLRGSTRKKFYSFLGESYPELIPKFDKLYKTSNVSKTYHKGLDHFISELRKKYELFEHYSQPKSRRKLTLFE